MKEREKVSSTEEKNRIGKYLVSGGKEKRRRERRIIFVRRTNSCGLYEWPGIEDSISCPSKTKTRLAPPVCFWQE